MTGKLVHAVFAAGVVGFVACGGKVVFVEGEGEGGHRSSTSASGLHCDWPEPSGSLVPCNTVGVGAGPGACATTYCDADGNRYEAECSGTTCSCTYNTIQKCTCGISAGDICGESPPYCCPSPLP